MLINFQKVDDNKQIESAAQVQLTIGSSVFPIARQLPALVDAVTGQQTMHYVTGGEWSMYELFIAMLERSGKAKVFISSYAFSDHSARILATLRNENRISELICILDNRVDVRSASALTILKNCSTYCRLVSTHAKVTVVEGEEESFVVVGSANYTENKRYEAGIITTDPDAIEFHKRWITKAAHNATDTREP
jgi:hypothetical protein